MLMATHDLYGSNLDLEPSRQTVEAALSIELRPHESLYRGGDYYRYGETFILQRNRELGDELAEPDFSDVSTLLYVDKAERPEQVKALLESEGSFVLLRREAS